jgi:hypothetical protein
MLAFRQGRALWRGRLLYGCACCRLVWAWLPADCRRAVEASERHADAPADAQGDAKEAYEAANKAYRQASDEAEARVREVVWGELGWGEPGLCRYRDAYVTAYAAQAAVNLACAVAHPRCTLRSPGFASRGGLGWHQLSTAVYVSRALRLAAWQSRPERQRAFRETCAAQAGLLRDVFGNPFRRAPRVGAWRTPEVLSLAQAAHEERALPAGHLDPARLAVLSDALEEAGCGDEGLLSHLRGPGPHVLGCWALDLILGMTKSA